MKATVFGALLALAACQVPQTGVPVWMAQQNERLAYQRGVKTGKKDGFDEGFKTATKLAGRLSRMIKFATAMGVLAETDSAGIAASEVRNPRAFLIALNEQFKPKNDDEFKLYDANFALGRQWARLWMKGVQKWRAEHGPKIPALKGLDKGASK